MRLFAGRNRINKVGAVSFDGSNDYMTRGADLTGNADGKTGLISFFIRIAGGDNTAREIYATSTTTNGNYIRINTSNNFVIVFKDALANNDLILQSDTAYVAGSTWHHVAASWNLATPVAHLYIDGADDEAAGSTENNDTMDYTTSNHSIGADTAGGEKVTADLAELYINLAEYMDITVASNLQKFRSPSGKPVYLGPDGSYPTGTAPIIYQRVKPGDAAADFATNRGTGGNFSITGTLTIASSSPSD